MSRYTILLVDDDDRLRDALQQGLVNAGYQVLQAANGREAARLATANHVDLVLTDLIMPEMDGIEVIAELRRTRPGTPVVAMSGGGRMPADQYLKFARTYGAKAILEKPFSTAQMLLTIGLLLPETKA